MPVSVAFIGSAHSVSGSTIPLAAYNQAAGNCIVVVVQRYLVTVTSITDTAGNTYVKLFSSDVGNTSGILNAWHAKNCKGNAANVVTVNFSSAVSYSSVYGYDVAGVSSGSPVDALFSGADSNLNFVTPIVSTTANDAIIAAESVNTAYHTFVKGLLGDVPTGQQLSSDPLTEGSVPSNFTAQSGSWASDITNGLYATAVSGAGGFATIYENTQTWPNDQYSEVVMSAAAAGNDIGPAVRMSTSAQTYYYATIVGTAVYIQSMLSGTEFTLASQSGVTYAAGTVLRLSVVGSILSAYINGTLWVQVTDASIASGKAGMQSRGTGSSSTMTMKNWSGGSASAPPPAMTFDANDGQGGIQAGVQHAVLTQTLVTGSLLLHGVTGGYLVILLKPSAGGVPNSLMLLGVGT